VKSQSRVEVVGSAVGSKNAGKMQLADARCIFAALAALTAPPTTSTRL
jgi:hypothetical protein